MKFYLLRHARYIYSLKDYQKLKQGPKPSEQGVKETEAFAKKIAGRKFLAIYSNSANRSKISAQIIARANKYHPHVSVDDDIRPMRVDYKGPDIVEHVKSAKQRARTGERWMDGELPSIEPLADFMARNLRFFIHKVAEYADKKGDILVIAHWETFAAAQATFKNISFRKASYAHEHFKYNKLYEFKV